MIAAPTERRQECLRYQTSSSLKLPHYRVRASADRYFDADLLGADGTAGLANLAASIAAFGCTEVSLIVDWPSTQVSCH